MSLNLKSNHYIVVNINFWSLLLIFIIINSTQGSQRFERRPEGTYQRLRGQDLDIPCTVRGREGECLWLKNNHAVGNIPNKYQFLRQPSNGDCSLHIYNLDPKFDEGEWQCQVTSPNIHESTISSDPVKVVVLVAPNPPSIRSVESNQLRVYSDRSNEIECISSNGNPAPRIEWYIDGENVTIHSRTNIDSITGDSPKVTSFLSYIFKRMHRNSTISCLSIHQTITQNTSALINVMYAPQVSVPQKVYTINEGNSLTVQCLVDSNPITNAVWKAIDTEVKHEFRTEYRTNSLIIDRVTKSMNKAVFECSARNEFGASNDEQITLDVLFEPTLIRASEPQQSVELGDSIRLYCEYDGNPVPKIMWFHINPITDQVRNRPNNEANASFLVIQNATYHDEGHYYCEALNHNSITNKELIVRSAKIIVDIMGKPAIIQKKDTAYGYRGTDTDVEQIFCSDPTPTSVYWQYGSMRVDIKDDRYGNVMAVENNISKSMRHKARGLIAMDKHGSWPKPTCFRAILSITNTDITDQREYTLNVENARGITQSVIKLKVNSPVSAAIMITIGLIVLIMLLALTLVTMLVIKRRKLAKEKADDESKAEARAPIKSDTDKPEKEPEKAKGENDELVYANLDFAKPEPKPSKAKPQAQQRQHKTNGGNSGTEYAQITFTNKADL